MLGAWQTEAVNIPALVKHRSSPVLHPAKLVTKVTCNQVLQTEVLLELVVVFDHLVSPPLQVVDEGTPTVVVVVT